MIAPAEQTRALLPCHREDLDRSGLTDETIKAALFYSATREEAKALLGFDPQSGGWVLPYSSRVGLPDTLTFKPDSPGKDEKGRLLKYLRPLKSQNRVYVPPMLSVEALQGKRSTLYIVEGEKKALKAGQEGLVCIAIPGVWNWKYRDEKGDSRTIPDLLDVYLKGRVVNICFDSDIVENPSVAKAEYALSEKLKTQGAIISGVRLPSGQNGAKIGLDDFLLNHTVEDLRNLPRDPLDAPPASGPKKEPHAEALIRIASKAELFHDDSGEAYAAVTTGKARMIFRLKGRDFRRWLAGAYYRQRGKASNGEALSAALNVIEAEALFKGQRIELSNRFAHVDNSVWIDLADEQWRAVRIDQDGWKIVDRPPILFKRLKHQKQISTPKQGELTDILKFLNIPDKDDQILFLSWLVVAPIADIPRPIVVFHGPQGSAKTTATKLGRALLDPSAIDAGLGRDAGELAQTLDHNAITVFDNLSHVQGWQSNLLCRAVTGGGFSKRQLYTDSEDVILSFKRAILLNGINVPGVAPDLLDRCILIGLDRIREDKRKEESKVLQEFDEARPFILGGLLDALAAAMRIYPNVTLKRLPRMADFARWGEAAARGMGYKKNAFMDALFRNIGRQLEEVIEGDPVAAAMVDFMEDRQEWKGAPSDLFKALTDKRKDKLFKGDGWPRAVNAFTRRLNVLRSTLSDAGFAITFGRSGNSGRTVGVRKISTLSTPSTFCNKNNELGGDDTSVDISTPQNTDTKPTPHKSLINNENVDSVDSVDKIRTLSEGDPEEEVIQL